jgi:hypothetical protein
MIKLVLYPVYRNFYYLPYIHNQQYQDVLLYHWLLGIDDGKEYSVKFYELACTRCNVKLLLYGCLK